MTRWGGIWAGRWGGWLVAPPAAFFAPEREFGSWLSDKLGMAVGFGHSQPGEGLPRVAYHLISGQPFYHLGGYAGAGRYVVQIDVWGGDPETPSILQAKIRHLLGNYRGPMGLSFCQAAVPGRLMSDYAPSLTESSSGSYRSMSEWTLVLNG